MIRLPVGTFGDLYTPVNVQLAVSLSSSHSRIPSHLLSILQGLYPVIVLLLVNQGGSLDRTLFVGSVAAMHVHVSTAGNANHAVSTVLFRPAVDFTEIETDEATAMSTMSSSPGSPRDAEVRRRVCERCGREDVKKEKREWEWDKLPEVRLEPFEVSMAGINESVTRASSPRRFV